MGGYSSLANLRHIRTSTRQAPASATGGYRILSFALDVARRHSACKGDGRPDDLETGDAHRQCGRLICRELSRAARAASGSVLFATQRRLAREANRDQPTVAGDAHPSGLVPPATRPARLSKPMRLLRRQGAGPTASGGFGSRRSLRTDSQIGSWTGLCIFSRIFLAYVAG